MCVICHIIINVSTGCIPVLAILIQSKLTLNNSRLYSSSSKWFDTRLQFTVNVEQFCTLYFLLSVSSIIPSMLKHGFFSVATSKSNFSAQVPLSMSSPQGTSNSLSTQFTLSRSLSCTIVSFLPPVSRQTIRPSILPHRLCAPYVLVPFAVSSNSRQSPVLYHLVRVLHRRSIASHRTISVSR